MKEDTLITLLENSGVSVFALEKPTSNNHCIVYRIISPSDSFRTMQGRQYDRTRFQIDCFGTTYKESRDLAEYTKNILDGNNKDFLVSYLVNEFTDKDIELNLYRSILEFYIF
jgi:hypothetical protein